MKQDLLRFFTLFFCSLFTIHFFVFFGWGIVFVEINIQFVFGLCL